jgi:hypothetical protein
MATADKNHIYNKVILFYCLMLAAHFAHVLEEIWGSFWLLNIVGLAWYLIINWLLFCIPLGLFYYTLKRNLWAYNFSIVYALFMAIQGIGHLLLIFITGQYFDGYAGGFTGIALFIVGVPMVYYLRKARLIIKN